MVIPKSMLPKPEIVVEFADEQKGTAKGILRSIGFDHRFYARTLKEIIMMTLRQFSTEPSTIPTITSWYIADLSKAQGKQELFTHQSPQKLRILREHALIESAISSNRIEGINVEKSRHIS